MNLEEYKKVYNTKVDTLKSYNSFLVDSGRRVGKTTALINALPVGKKCIVVTHSKTFARYLEDLIREHRPDINFRDVTIVTHTNDNLNGLCGNMGIKGKRGELFIDNAVIDNHLFWYLETLGSCFAERPAARKMTKSEIETILGYKVDIIDDNL